MADSWAERDLLSLREQNRALRQEIMRLNVEVAQLRLNDLIAKTRDRSDVAWLQGKVLRQQRRLNALETEHAYRVAMTKADAEARRAAAEPEQCRVPYPGNDWRCVRNKDHEGPHGYAGVFWNDDDAVTEALHRPAPGYPHGQIETEGP